MVSNKFKELEFINYQQNKVLVYPSNLKMESLMIDNFELQSNLKRANQTSLGGDPKTVMNAEKVLNEKIKNHSIEMPWPPEEKDLGSNNVAEYIPEFARYLLHHPFVWSDVGQGQEHVWPRRASEELANARHSLFCI